MRSYSQNKPIGAGADANFFQKILTILRNELQFYDSTTISVEQTTRGIRLHAKNRIGGVPITFWQSPKELDPSVAVSKDTFVYISDLAPIVTAGITDLVGNTPVKSCPGVWQAAQDVPPWEIVDSVTKYNVPVFPYPSGLGNAVTGSPLKGDLDAVDGSGKPAIFWIYWGQVAC